MTNNEQFLSSYRLVSRNQAEYTLLSALYYSCPNMVFLFELFDLNSITSRFQDVVNFINSNYRSYQIDLFSLNADNNLSQQPTELQSIAKVKDEDFYNVAMSISSHNHSYVLVRAINSSVLVHDGIFERDFDNTYADRKRLQEEESRKIDIDNLEYAFALFRFNRQQKGCDYIINGKVSNLISEQSLRNRLIDFLKKETKLNVYPEFCTSMMEDEESVDISVIDKNNNVSIIEVKYFVMKGKFEDCEKRAYSFSRFNDGYVQLNRYCEHLNQDDYNLHSAFLYMFYAHSDSRQAIESKSQKFLKDFLLSSECNEYFKYSFRKTICDDMLER